MATKITGWKLPEPHRSVLLQHFAPRYPRLVADHVTLKFGTDETRPLPTQTCGRIVGYADDRKGVEALVIEIDGSTSRGDGSHYHITWSLAEGREAKDSNEVLQAGWVPVEPSIEIPLEPARWYR